MNGINATSYFFYQLAYLTQEPVYVCTYTDPLTKTGTCDSDQICSNDGSIASYIIDWSDQRSIHNWVEKMDLICEPKWKIALLGSLVFIGWGSTLSWLPRLADKFGRKPLFLLGIYLDLVYYIGIYLCHNLNLMYVLLFLFGCTCSLRVQVGFVYMMEMIPAERKTFYGTICNL